MCVRVCACVRVWLLMQGALVDQHAPGTVFHHIKQRAASRREDGVDKPVPAAGTHVSVTCNDSARSVTQDADQHSLRSGHTAILHFIFRDIPQEFIGAPSFPPLCLYLISICGLWFYWLYSVILLYFKILIGYCIFKLAYELSLTRNDNIRPNSNRIHV